MHNWSKNLNWNPSEILYPKSPVDAQQIVHKALREKRNIRMIGSGHSFTSIMVTDDYLVSLDKYQGLIHVDRDTNEVTVKAGTKLHLLSTLLEKEGLAMPNMGDIDSQSVAGAISTGTHGTGIEFGNLSTMLSAITFVNGHGDILTWRKDDGMPFRALQLSLGTMGIIMDMTIECIPKYNLKLQIEGKKLDYVLDNLEDFNSRNRNFEFYWFPHTNDVMTKQINIANNLERDQKMRNYYQEVILENYVFKGVCEISTLLPSLSKKISSLSASSISKYSKVTNSYRVYSTTRLVKFNEMEYNVPLHAFKDVKKEITRWINKHNHKIMFPIENRFVKGDNLPLSPAYQRDSAYIAVHAYHKKDYKDYFSNIETIFKHYGGRPHWGKIHTLTEKDFRDLYPEFNTFNTIRKEQDPEGIFLSEYMKTLFI